MNKANFVKAKYILEEIDTLESIIRAINYKPTSLRDDYTESPMKAAGLDLRNLCKKKDGFRERVIALLQSEIDILNREFEEL